jgi:hypothetical protein
MDFVSHAPPFPSPSLGTPSLSYIKQIVVLSDGSVLEKGTHAQLLSKQGTYAGLWEMQARAASGHFATAAAADDDKDNTSSPVEAAGS